MTTHLAASTNKAAKHFWHMPVHLLTLSTWSTQPQKIHGKDGWQTKRSIVDGIWSPARRKQHFQPARTCCHFLPWIVGTPALSKTNAYRVGVYGPRARIVPVTRTRRFVGIEDIQTVTWRYPIYQKRPWFRILQCWRVDEDGAVRTVVSPHTVSLLAQCHTWKPNNLVHSCKQSIYINIRLCLSSVSPGTAHCRKKWQSWDTSLLDTTLRKLLILLLYVWVWIQACVCYIISPTKK